MLAPAALLCVLLLGAAVGSSAPGAWTPTEKWTADEDLLGAGDGPDRDEFGWAVDLDGATAAVGAPGSGTVYLHQRSQSGWARMAEIQRADEAFAQALAIDDGTLVVGADDAAYVFEGRSGSWAEVARLVPEPTAEALGDPTVDVDGNTVVLGVDARRNGDGHVTGAAAVYERTAGGWEQTAFLTVQDVGCIGDRVAVDGGTIALGDPCSKTVQIYEREPDGWSHTASLEPENAWFYAKGLAIDEDTGRVAAGDPRFGFVDIWERTPDGWARTTRIEPGDPWPFDWRDNGFFGHALDLEGDTLTVGAPIDDASPGPLNVSADADYPCGMNPPSPVPHTPPCTGPGATYLFQQTSDAGWFQTQKLTSEQSPWDAGFGTSVALSGGSLLVGDWYQDTSLTDPAGGAAGGVGTSHGTAYLYEDLTSGAGAH